VEDSAKPLTSDASWFPVRQAWLFFFVLGLGFVLVGQMWSRGFPIWDDYHAILAFLVDLVSASAPADRLSVLVRLHNEHLILMPRLLFAIAHVLPGPVSFRLILLIGHAFLGVVAFLLARRGTSQGMTLWPVVVAVVAFSLIHFRLLYWPMAAVSNFLVIAFGVGAAQLAVSDQRRDQVLSLLLGAGALLTTGGGVFFVVTIAAGLVLFRPRVSMPWIALATAGIALVVYQLSVAEAASDAVSGNGILSSLPLIAGRWAAMLGSMAVVPEVAIGAGVVGLVLWVVLLLRGPRHSSPSYISGIVILTSMVLTAAAVAVSRSEFGLAQAVDGRYRIVSIVFWIVTAEMLWTNLLREGAFHWVLMFRVAIGAMLLVSVAGSVLLAPRIMEHANRFALLRETFSSGESLPEGEWPIPGDANIILENSESLGITAYRRRDGNLLRRDMEATGE
jgi:hypothetical protein